MAVRLFAVLLLIAVSTSAQQAPARQVPPPHEARTLADALGSHLSTIADAAWAGSSVNVVANARQALFTHQGTQFAAYYDEDGFMVLARRAVNTDTWERRQTTSLGRVADAHNSISIAVDGAGFLHVAWDHHANTLNYARGVAPGSLQLGPRQPMTGTRENRVTYPQFWRLPDGNLLFLYRDGSSGNGSLVLNRYSVDTQTWKTVQRNLVDGEGLRSPYWDMTVDRTDTLHLMWIWRESPDVATNHDICYARSSDQGRTWTRTDGTRLSVPITASTAEYAVRIPQNSNLMNSPVLTTDADGHPYAVTYWSPSSDSPPRFHVVHHDGSRWRTVDGPSRTERFVLSGGGTKAPPISRAVVLVEPRREQGRLHLVYRDAAVDGVVVASRAWPSDGPWIERRLSREALGAWEPAIDPTAWTSASELHMLLQRVTQRDGDDRQRIDTPGTPVGVLSWKPAEESGPLPRP